MIIPSIIVLAKHDWGWLVIPYDWPNWELGKIVYNTYLEKEFKWLLETN